MADVLKDMISRRKRFKFLTGRDWRYISTSIILDKGKPIKFRQYLPLGSLPIKGATRTKTGLLYTEETLGGFNVRKESHRAAKAGSEESS